ncbi:PadR family transcriptional regulator [Brevibacillus reuszeri]|uniref:PadR family transcriptional regulator n=1 Tax=Brevibacillus reuszeri TaxID=54915 RepID=UPI00289A6198|nr:PadR family transcriptional regulator [Brevibacillus reuszeri]
MRNHFRSPFSSSSRRSNDPFHGALWDEKGDSYYRHGGHGGRGKRFFGRGDVKYALLELLSTEPMHGYQMMKGLEEKTGGLYSPSPGSIYPTLQMLEDRELVTSEDVGGKKTYSITEAGLVFLQERQTEEKREILKEQVPADLRERNLELQQELHELVETMKELQKKAENDPVQLSRLIFFVKKVRHKLEGHFGEDAHR